MFSQPAGVQEGDRTTHHQNADSRTGFIVMRIFRNCFNDLADVQGNFLVRRIKDDESVGL